MNKSVFTICAAALGLLLASPRPGVCQGSNTASSLQVHATYSGAGTVDEKHKIYVVLWDTPDFIRGGAMPVSIEPTSSNNAIVTFPDVQKTPAYISSVYDSSGTWDAQSAPPEGSSLGIYSKAPGKPEPIDLKPGKPTKIDLTFDDSVKMKDGQAAH